jgi:hypothetical protein
VGLVPSWVRGMSARVLEWRAMLVTDPVERLQFLQRARASPVRKNRRSALLIVTLAFAAASAAFVEPVWRHSALPRSRFTATLHLGQKPETAPGHVWLVESNERFELYSNGLQVQNQFVTGTQARAYRAFARDGLDTSLPSCASTLPALSFTPPRATWRPLKKTRTEHCGGPAKACWSSSAGTTPITS